MKKRFLAMILAVIMTLCLLPTVAFAAPINGQKSKTVYIGQNYPPNKAAAEFNANIGSGETCSVTGALPAGMSFFDVYNNKCFFRVVGTPAAGTAGQYTITASSDTENSTMTCTITVAKGSQTIHADDGTSADVSTITIPMGADYTLNTYSKDGNGDKIDVGAVNASLVAAHQPKYTYASSNESIATVNSTTGVVTPVSRGTTTITINSATTNSYEAAAAKTITLNVGYGVTNTLTNITTNGKAAVALNTDYSATLTADTGYRLPASITVKVGDTELAAGADYTYSGGSLTILAAKINGNIEITAVGVLKTYTATVTPDGKTFDSRTLGYSTVTPETFTITSTGNQTLSSLAVTLDGTNKDNFTLGTTGTAISLDATGGTTTSTTFTVKPNDSLAAGTYTANIKVNADNMTEIVKSVSFKVNPKPTYAVNLPTGTGYTLTPETGSTSPVTEGESYSFKLTLDDNYKNDTDFAVKANGAALTEANGVYTIKNITAAQVVTVEGVVLKAANYTTVEEAIAKIPADLSVYTAETVKALNDAKAAIVRDKNITEQTTVDGYATAIENAIKALTYKGADYNKVDAAISKIPTDLSSYTDASMKALNDVKNAVVRGKNITEQKVVDGYATAIENAIKDLQYKPADYSKVDAAIAKIPADMSVYTDATVQALNDAKNAVIKGKNISEQIIVDGYAAAIENAITGLTNKPVATSPDTNSPQTGDTSDMALWIALLFVSGGALTTLVITKKRKSEANKKA